MSGATVWTPGADFETAKAVGLLYKGTSESSNAIADSGTLTFLTQTGLYFGVGEWIVIVDQANVNNWMSGQVASYNDETGSLGFTAKVKSGSGTYSEWYIYISGVWVSRDWNGGTVTNPVDIQSTLNVTGDVTLVDDLTVGGSITSPSGDINLNTTTTLSDADASLTAAQLFGGTLVITPTADRILTLPTAAQIIAYLTGSVVGSNFTFTVINNSAAAVSIAPNTGTVQVGKTVVQDGSVTFKVTVDSPTIVSVINLSTSTLSSSGGAISTGSVQSSAVDITLTSVSAKLQKITMTAEGNYVILQDATTLAVSSPTLVIYNDGYYPFGIKDAAGNVLTIVESGGCAQLSLVTNVSAAGVWAVSGEKLSNSFISASTVLASTYSASTIFHLIAELDSNISVLFAAIASNGIAVFSYDNSTKTFGTVSTLTTLAGAKVKAAFKIDSTRLMVFYSDVTDKLYASVLIIVGNIVVVGTAGSTGTITDIAVDDGIAEPKICQLDSNLFAVSYATANGAGVTAVIGCQVSDVTSVNFGSAANINTAADNQQSSTVSFALTTTTLLVLYKVQGAPKTNKAVVVSVTNANPPVCTVGTPVAGVLSTTAKAVSCALLTPTLAVWVDDNNVAGSAIAQAITISGTTVSVGATASMDTGIGALIDFKVDFASRRNPHVNRVSDTSFLFWCRDSAGASRVIAATVAAGVVSPGNKVTGSFSSALDGSAGAGTMLPLGNGSSEFVGIIVTRDSGADTNRKHVVIAHKISGNSITVGKAKAIESVLPLIAYPSNYVMAVRTSSGVYGVCSSFNGILGGDVGIQLFKTDGLNIVDLGIVEEYASGNRLGAPGSTMNTLPYTGNRIFSLAPAFGIKAPASAVQLLVNNIVVVP